MHDLRAVLDGEPTGDLPLGDLADFLAGTIVRISAHARRGRGRGGRAGARWARLGLWTLFEPSDMTCVLVSLQSTSHTKPGISFPANSQNVSIILHPSVWQSSGMYIKKAGLLVLDWNSVNFGMVSSVSRIISAAASSRPASMTSGACGCLMMLSRACVAAACKRNLQPWGETRGALHRQVEVSGRRMQKSPQPWGSAMGRRAQSARSPRRFAFSAFHTGASAPPKEVRSSASSAF